MDSNTYFKFCGVVVILLLCRVLSTTSDECSTRSPKWKDFGGNYCYIIEENVTVSWIDAVYQCFSEGGSLASFHSPDDAEHVINNVQNRTKGLYIGLRKRSDGTFEWVDKSAVDFTNWYPGEPNLYFERCTQVYAESGMWNDVTCSETFGYICSKPKTKRNVLAPTKACPETSDDWRDFGGDFCYILEEESKASQEDAVQRCSEAGGSLASFHSFEEISSVLQRIRSHRVGFHIGLRLNIQGEYEWLDGSPFDLNYFDIWHRDSESRKCVAMSPQNGEWFGLSCNYVLGYICAVPKGTCGGVIVSESGVIQTPRYPSPYRKNENCTWEIIAPENHIIALQFRTFEVESGYRCIYDSVVIRDGLQTDDPVLGTFCGFIIPKTIQSSSNKMSITFESDGSNEEKGFEAIFRTKDISKLVSVESLLQKLPSSFTRKKIQATKDNLVYKPVRPTENNLVYKPVRPTEEEKYPDKRIKSAAEVALQQL